MNRNTKLILMILALGATPALAQPRTGGGDADGDGVPDAVDACPGTPRGAPIVTRGCTALDLASAPRLLLDPIDAAIDVVGEGAEGDKSLKPLTHALDRARKAGGDVLDLLEQGRPCDGADALRGLGHELDAAGALLIGMRQAAQPVAPRSAGDASDTDLRLGLLELRSQNNVRALETVAETSAALQRLCGESRPFTRTARVKRIDDAAGQIELEDGSRYAITVRKAGGKRTDPLLAAGLEVTLTGAGVYVTDYTSIELPSTGITRPTIQCVDLRVAPVQPFGPLNPGPYTLHDLKAYKSLGVLILERGARLGLQLRGCPDTTPSPSQKYWRYSVELEMAYKDCNGFNHSKSLLAYDLDTESEPIGFPCVSENSAATLTVTYRRMSCQLSGSTPVCFTQEDYATETHTIAFRQDRSFCTAVYDKTGFNLDDQPAGTFLPATVTGMKLGPWFDIDPGQTPVFEALGYKLTGGVPSATGIPVHQGEGFAVYNDHDFFDPNGIWQPQLTGVLRPSGLMWPKVKGVRNGKPFWYSCDVPALVRDQFATCGAQPPSYYRLPFEGGFPIWVMGQGNNNPDPTATHCITDTKGNPCYNRYAFDFVASGGTNLYAARSGVVTGVIDTNSGNCKPPCAGCGFSPNQIFIRHQDGTIGVYMHMFPDGIFVSPGDVVQRGGLIGQVGNVGCSSTPHLHFQVNPGPGATQSMPITFQENKWASNPGVCLPGTPTSCQVPKPGDKLCSNN